MNTRMPYLSMVVLCLLSLFTAVSLTRTIPAEAASTQGISPAGMLNADGTLRLDGRFHGALNLSGYQVQIDPQRGPVFRPANNLPTDTQVAGLWDNLSGGGSAIHESIAAVAVSGANVYVGGSFVNADSIPAADYVARWDGTQWSALGSNGAGEGVITTDSWSWVNALAVDGAGNLYVGGSFGNLNNHGTVLQAADAIAKWDGANWSALGSDGAGNGSLSGEVYAIVVNGPNVYVGGDFTDVNNHSTVLAAADYIARWDGTNWSALGGTNANNGSLNSWVGAIAVYGANVYAGGGFTNVQNNATVLTAADYIAKWDGTNWSAMGGTNLNEGAFTDEIYALAVDADGNVYAGGAFTNVRAGIFSLLTADYIAKWNGTSWTNLGSNGGSNGSLSGPVSDIAVGASGDVYVGGSFANVNNNGALLNAADGVAKWNGTNWSALGSNGAGDGAILSPHAINSLAVSGTKVYVVGSFSSVNNGGLLLTQAAKVAQWDGSNWSGLASTGNGSLNDAVYALAVNGSAVYIGGRFTNIVDQGTMLTAADYIAKWDGTHWSALGHNGAGDGALNSIVGSLAISGNNLYVGGGFTNVNNKGTLLPAADYVARWDGTNWSALGSGAGGNGSINGFVTTLAATGNNVYAGGEFTNVNNSGTVLTAADYVARWNGSNWSALGSNGAGNGSLNLYVNSLAVSGTAVYVGGQFDNVNNNGVVLTAADKLAKWDGMNWSALGNNGSGDGSIGCGVWALFVSGPYLYAGGCFADVNNYGTLLPAADYIARWDGTNWSALGSNGVNNGALNFIVGTIAVDGANVFVGGRFLNVNNNGSALPAADYIARWDGANWSALSHDGAGDGSLSCDASALGISGTHLYVGGCFSDINNYGTILPETDYVAVYHFGLQNVYLPLVRK